MSEQHNQFDSFESNKGKFLYLFINPLSGKVDTMTLYFDISTDVQELTKKFHEAYGQDAHLVAIFCARVHELNGFIYNMGYQLHWVNKMNFLDIPTENQ